VEVGGEVGCSCPPPPGQSRGSGGSQPSNKKKKKKRPSQGIVHNPIRNFDPIEFQFATDQLGRPVPSIFAEPGNPTIDFFIENANNIIDVTTVIVVAIESTVLAGPCCGEEIATIIFLQGLKTVPKSLIRRNAATSTLARVSDLARRAKITDKFFNDKVLRFHGPTSTIPRKSRFSSAFDIRSGIRRTLDSSDSLILPNTQGRAGSILIRDFGGPIGTNVRGNPVNRLKVVIDDFGNLVTAFPIR